MEAWLWLFEFDRVTRHTLSWGCWSAEDSAISMSDMYWREGYRVKRDAERQVLFPVIDCLYPFYEKRLD